MTTIILILIGISMVWVGYDAKQRDWSQKKRGAKTASGQILGVVLLWFVFFPVYLFQRRNVPHITASPDVSPLLTGSIAAAPTTKVCPECAETVQLAARRSKHCGYRFDAGRRPAQREDASACRREVSVPTPPSHDDR
jgi:protein-S-isoprenylcysteine O-methyltransferase Ste14